MSKSRRNPPAAENRIGKGSVVEMLTVGWGLTVLTTLIADVSAIVISLVARWWGATPGLEIVAATLTFSAIVTGLIGVGLTVYVVTAREEPPPRNLVYLAILVSAFPWVLMIGRYSL